MSADNLPKPLPSVLVVDDEQVMRDLLAESLEEYFQITVAASGEEALSLLEPDRFDVLLADQRMPGITGVQLAREAGCIDPHLVAVLLSAYTDPKDMLAAINEGQVFRFLTKPWEHHDLVLTLQQAAERRHLTRSNERMLSELERRLRALEIVQEVLGAAAAGSVKHPAGVLLRRLEAVLPFDLAALFLAGSESTPCSLVLRTAASVHEQNAIELRDQALECFRYLSKLEVPDEKIYLASQGWSVGSVPYERPESQVQVPLRLGRQLVGVLVLQAFDAGAFSADAERLLDILANGTAEALRAMQEGSERHWRGLGQALNALPDGVLVTRRDGTMLLANDAARRMLGAGAEGAEGDAWQKLGLSADALWRIANAGEDETVQCGDRFLRVGASAIVWQPAGEVALLAMMRDETKNLDEGQRRRDYLATVSHEIRTPLSSVVASLEILQAEGETAFDRGQRHHLDVAQRSLLGLENLLNDLLEHEKHAAWELPQARDDADLKHIAKTVMERFEPVANLKGSCFHLSAAENIPRAPMDSRRIEQAVANLCANAVKFAEPNSTISLHLGTTNHQWLVLGVKNAGTVLPAEDIERIFQRFEQGTGMATTERPLGTGLGLAIARSIAFSHGGWLLAEILPDGMGFWMALPVVATTRTDSWSRGAGPFWLFGEISQHEKIVAAAILAQAGIGVRLLPPGKTQNLQRGAWAIRFGEEPGGAWHDTDFELVVPSFDENGLRQLAEGLSVLCRYSGRSLRTTSPPTEAVLHWLSALGISVGDDPGFGPPLALLGHCPAQILAHLGQQLADDGERLWVKHLLEQWREMLSVDDVLCVEFANIAAFRASYGLARWIELRQSMHERLQKHQADYFPRGQLVALEYGFLVAGQRPSLSMLAEIMPQEFGRMAMLHYRRHDRLRGYMELGHEKVRLPMCKCVVWDIKDKVELGAAIGGLLATPANARSL